MNRPFPAYRGDAPYVFVCYSHRDAALVYPELAWLRSQGFNIWYDEGISAGAEWRDEIAHALDQSSAFVFFLSENAADSADCLREVAYASDARKPLLTMELRETELRGGLKLTLAPLQIVRRHEIGESASRTQLLDSLRRHLQHSIRVISGQCVLVSDLLRFGVFARSRPPEAIEALLVGYENIVQETAHAFEGILRSIEGDACLLSFGDAERGVEAASSFAARWAAFAASRDHDVPLAIGASYGDFRVFRSFCFDQGMGAGVLATANRICELAKLLPVRETNVVIGERLVEQLQPRWKLKELSPGDFLRDDDVRTPSLRQLYSDVLTANRLYELGGQL